MTTYTADEGEVVEVCVSILSPNETVLMASNVRGEFNISYSGGQATDEDFSFNTSRITLNSTSSTKCFDISITTDGLVEGVETFELSLALDTGADYFGIRAVSPNQTEITIQDHDTSLEMDPYGYCGQEMMATFTGTGISVTAKVEGVERPAIIARNTIHPLFRGEFVFILYNVTPVVGRGYVKFIVNVYYNMTPETSGKELTITAGGDDAVTGQTTLKSEECSFMVDWAAQNETTHFIEWKQPNCSGFTKISKYIVTMECGCDATLDVCTWEETLSSEATNASFKGLPTGPCKVCVTAVNYCGEETFTKLNFSIEPNSGEVIHKTSRRWMWMILLAMAVHQLWL